MLPPAIARKPMVMAVDMPVRDQPVASAMGTISTGSANMAPAATHPSNAPATTMTQRYPGSVIPSLLPAVGGRLKLIRIVTSVMARSVATKQSSLACGFGLLRGARNDDKHWLDLNFSEQFLSDDAC